MAFAIDGSYLDKNNLVLDDPNTVEHNEYGTNNNVPDTHYIDDKFYDCLEEEPEQYFDTSQYQNIKYDIKKNYKKPFHLKINHGQLEKGQSHQFLDQDIVDTWLQTLSYDELVGYHTAFEPFVFALTTVNNLQKLEDLQPKLGWKPLEVIKRTLNTTTQWAITKTYFPLRKHHVSRFPWNNRSRLKEIVSMDTIFPQ